MRCSPRRCSAAPLWPGFRRPVHAGLRGRPRSWLAALQRSGRGGVRRRVHRRGGGWPRGLPAAASTARRCLRGLLRLRSGDLHGPPGEVRGHRPGARDQRATAVSLALVSTTFGAVTGPIWSSRSALSTWLGPRPSPGRSCSPAPPTPWPARSCSCSSAPTRSSSVARARRPRRGRTPTTSDRRREARRRAAWRWARPSWCSPRSRWSRS